MRRFLKILGALLLGIIVILGILWNVSLQQLQNLTVQHTDTPTLFIPGDDSNWTSFGPMADRFENYSLAKERMIVHVADNGHLDIKQLGPLTDNPLILVYFDDSTHAKKEAPQLKKILTYLHDKHNISAVNLVSHSSGGDVCFNYLTDQPLKNVHVAKWITIADNFPDSVTNGKTLPKGLKILNIAGNISWAHGDLVVSTDEAKQLKAFAEKQGIFYQDHIFNGTIFTAYHSMLHQNAKVDRWIAQFLFN
ncbi:alpha/beta hydrolase [Lactobacillus selangorensis]|nr:alpha/beta hydrolase [Lactobacillus selangorensis]